MKVLNKYNIIQARQKSVGSKRLVLEHGYWAKTGTLNPTLPETNTTSNFNPIAQITTTKVTLKTKINI